MSVGEPTKEQNRVYLRSSAANMKTPGLRPGLAFAVGVLTASSAVPFETPRYARLLRDTASIRKSPLKANS